MGALGTVSGALPQPGGGDHRTAGRGADDRQQHVQALDAGVAATGALLGVAECRFHGVIDIDVGQCVGNRE